MVTRITELKSQEISTLNKDCAYAELISRLDRVNQQINHICIIDQQASQQLQELLSSALEINKKLLNQL